MALEAEIDAAVKVLYKYGSTVKDNRQRIAGLGGAYMASATEAATPRGTKVHYRYATAKVVRGIRAPKGMGKKVATYYPGNLAASSQVLRFRRAKTKVYVGAKLAKGRASGSFGRGVRTDGYYLGMVESGTKNMVGRKFWTNAVTSATPRTLAIMLNEWGKLTDKFNAQNAV